MLNENSPINGFLSIKTFMGN